VNLLRRLVTAAPVIVVIAVACGGNQLVDPTVVTPVTVEPSGTVQPSPTANILPTAVPPARESLDDLASLSIPVCRTDPFAGDLSGFGTIPRVSEDGTTFSSDFANSDAEIIAAVAPIIRWMNHFTTKADTAWELADSEQEFADVLSEEGRRLWLSCNAVALVAPAIETTHPLLISFKSLLAHRQAWLTERLEILRTAPDSIRDDNVNRAVTSKAIKELPGSLDVLGKEARVENRATPEAFTVPNPLLGVSLDFPGGWMLIRNRIDIVLAAPPEHQMDGVTGLGVSGWNFGTALRMKRLRHEAPWTLTDTANLMDSLLFRFGERVIEDQRKIDGLEAVIRVYDSSDADWVMIAAATVRDLHTYLFEFGCPAEDQVSCEVLFQDLLDNVRFNEG
jgi:hypothetical protein